MTQKPVDRLTPEQEAHLTPWRDQWLAHGLSTQREVA